MSIYPSVCGGYGVRGDKGDPGPAGPPGRDGVDGTILNTWRGTWVSTLSYLPGDLVEHEGSVYLLGPGPSIPSFYALISSPEPPEAPWEMFARRGKDGGSRSGLGWRGEWAADTTYPEDSVVEFEGSAYVAALDAPKGVKPPVAPWEMLAKQGTQGPPGEQGIQGKQGRPGDPGEPGQPGEAGKPGIPSEWFPTWMPEATYTKGQAAFHEGSTFLAFEDVPTGTAPPANPWKMFAAKGDSGGASTQKQATHLWFMRDGTQAAVFGSAPTTWTKDSTWPAQMRVTVPEDDTLVKVTIMGGFLSRDPGTEGLMIRWKQETPEAGTAFGSENNPPHRFSMIGGSGRLVGMSLTDSFEHCKAGTYDLMVQTYYTDTDGSRGVFPGPSRNPDLLTVMDAAVHVEVFPPSMVED